MKELRIYDTEGTLIFKSDLELIGKNYDIGTEGFIGRISITERKKIKRSISKIPLPPKNIKFSALPLKREDRWIEAIK